VTAGAWDISPAWLDQLSPGGRLVLPLSVRGIQLSVGLERGEGCWVATSAFRCGFVRMAGAFADPEPFRPLGLSPGLYVQADDGRQVDPAALAAALGAPALDVGAGLRARSRDELADLDLWLTLTQPGLTRLTIMETTASRAEVGPLLPFGGLTGDEGGLGIVGLAGVRPPRGTPSTASRPGLDQRAYPGEIVLRGYGPAGPTLAGYLARQVSAWDKLDRPGTAGLALTVWPGESELTQSEDQIVLRRPHVRLAAGWPTARGAGPAPR
jgi:protein-L-isoaspartate(D-aspartate) O-methyltransferase